MAQSILVDPPLGILNKPAEPPKKPARAIGYVLIGCGLAFTVAWSGFLVWIAGKGVLWMAS
jgi:hypothetical protein